MAERSLNDILIPGDNSDPLWEIFHENSKNWRASLALSTSTPEKIQVRMKKYHECLSYPGYPRIELPKSFSSLKVSLGDAITARSSVRNLVPCPLTLESMTTLLHYSYGMTRNNSFLPYPPKVRVVPSAGALYPLELYFHSAFVQGLPPGLYHYNPAGHSLSILSRGDQSQRIGEATLYPQYVTGAAVMLFITAIFERSTWKYADRGYRYLLIEAGHVAQNLSLVASALGLACFSLGGFVDREVDDLIGLDGVTHSTVYMIIIGSKAEDIGGSGGTPLPTV